MLDKQVKMKMEPPSNGFRPRSDSDWDQYRDLFTHLYKERNHTLPEVMTIMQDQHQFWASEKMYKNKIKAWGLRKYLKEDEAKQIVEGSENLAVAVNGAFHADAESEEMKERAARSLKRKRARQRALTTPSLASGSSPSPLPPSPTSTAVVPFTPPPQSPFLLPPEPVRITGVAEQFLFNLRNWTHDAFLNGHWDTQSTSQLRRGRRASRLLSSSLNSGIHLYQNGKPQLAWKEFDRAVAGFQNPELFKSWYYEIPFALLSEVSLAAQNGHAPLATMLLNNVKDWAHNFLQPGDSRYALFSTFGDLEVDQLRDLYGRAAKSMMDGLETRIDKGNKLLYEVRLNRALDMLGHDENADLKEFLPPVSEVDTAMGGPNNAHSVYFMLLEAYRLVVQDKHEEAEKLCSDVQIRLNAMGTVPGSIDLWRVGLAYRRLGRQQHAKERYHDARRSFNTALKYVSNDRVLSSSVLIEICQKQQSMASQMGDQGDVLLWTRMLEGLEQETKGPRVEEIDDGDDGEPLLKKQRSTPSRTASPGPTRRGTW